MIRQSVTQDKLKSELADDPVLKRFLGDIDKPVADSFTAAQLEEIKKALKGQAWKKHSIDFRPTIFIPFLPWSFYMVFLLGHNRRVISHSEKGIALVMFLLLSLLVLISILGFIMLVLYLIKSALGIDLFADESLGIWDEFKRLIE
ncbi:3-phosphoshikimate 1-carboxyvinyltransferase [Aliikangiella maris]|uniref:3-phosphoshikimate 1-carboxyvinyltransferase n=2 Tax=Aliikangiella maris TaxID=3162458 RepID=A0ABV3MS88_9GAMM